MISMSECVHLTSQLHKKAYFMLTTTLMLIGANANASVAHYVIPNVLHDDKIFVLFLYIEMC